MTEPTKTPLETTDKKQWQTLELKVLDVPTSTKTGAGRLQPSEGFILYRPS